MKNCFNFLSNRKIIYGTLIVFIVGFIVGAVVFYSKRIEEKLVQRHEQQLLLLREEHESNLKKVIETYSLSLRETKDKLLESEKKVASLTLEVKNLKSKQRTAKFKIVRPDGTVEEKEFTETQTRESNKMIRSIKEQFNARVAEIERRWSDIHRERLIEIRKEFEIKELEYKKQIASLEQERKTIIGSKRFGLEFGVLTNKNYYGHGTIDIMGPIFLGIHGELGSSNNLGVGLGIRF